MLRKASETDRALILNYCMAEPSINIFIIGDVEIYGFKSDFQEVWIQTVMETMTGIVLRYHDNFILYSRDLDMVYEEIADLIGASQPTVISGRGTVLEPLYPLLADGYGKKEMPFCELRDTTHLSEERGRVQIATVEDAWEIAEVYGKIAEFAGLYASDQERRYEQIAGRIKSGEGIHMIIRENGRIVSHGNTAAETSVSAMIGGVLTLPEFRRAGFARSIVSALCAYLADKQKSICLFYDTEEAGCFFQHMGFKRIDNWTLLRRK